MMEDGKQIALNASTQNLSDLFDAYLNRKDEIYVIEDVFTFPYQVSNNFCKITTLFTKIKTAYYGGSTR